MKADRVLCVGLPSLSSFGKVGDGIRGGKILIQN